MNGWIARTAEAFGKMGTEKIYALILGLVILGTGYVTYDLTGSLLENALQVNERTWLRIELALEKRVDLDQSFLAEFKRFAVEQKEFDRQIVQQLHENIKLHDRRLNLLEQRPTRRTEEP